MERKVLAGGAFFKKFLIFNWVFNIQINNNSDKDLSIYTNLIASHPIPLTNKLNRNSTQ